MINLSGSGVVRALFEPGGVGLQLDDQQHLLGLYSGIALAGGAFEIAGICFDIFIAPSLKFATSVTASLKFKTVVNPSLKFESNIKPSLEFHSMVAPSLEFETKVGC